MITDIEQYKQILAGDATPLVKDITSTKKSQHVNERWTGKVVDVNDPSKLGRVRIKIIGFYDDLDDNVLPWAIPDIHYMGSKCGGQIIPDLDTMVRGYFEQGDIQRPVYDSVAFNALNSESEFTSRQDDYPHTLVLFETDNGDYMTLNRKTGEMVFTHRTGALTVIDSNGNITIKGAEGKGVDKPNMSVQCMGDMNISVNGNALIESNGDVRIKAARFINLGNTEAQVPVNNLPNCPICGIKLSTQEKVKVDLAG